MPPKRLPEDEEEDPEDEPCCWEEDPEDPEDEPCCWEEEPEEPEEAEYRAARVFFPARPSAVSLLAVWKLQTAW